MRNFLNFCLLILLLTSCSEADAPEKTDLRKTLKPGQDREFTVYPDSEMKFIENEGGTFVEIIEGDKLVFKYHFSEAGDPDIADSGYNQYVIFEMDKSVEDFKLRAGNFNDANAHLRRSCYCPNTDYIPISGGFIEATKTGSLQWDIDFSVETLIEEDPEHIFTIEIEDSGVFKPE